jgi:methionine-gamma-lyase
MQPHLLPSVRRGSTPAAATAGTVRPPFSPTLAVHAGREDLAALGVHVPPLDWSTTYPLGDLDAAVESLDALAAGREPTASPVYARLHNPTVARFEHALAALEGASGAVAFASGMAALTAALLAARRRGGHVVAVRPLYGTSDHLLACNLLGLEVDFVAADGVAAALRPDTALVLVETPANPTCELVDIAEVVRQAGRVPGAGAPRGCAPEHRTATGSPSAAGGGVPVLVDNTFATPVLQRPLDHGATLVLHSATKALGGHGDVVGGVLACRDEGWLAAIRQVRLLTGGILHPLAGYLLHRGLQTLGLRVERASASASELARCLAEHPAVERVHYPGLAGGDPRGLLGRQLALPGGVLAFELAGGRAAAGRLLASLRLITPAVSLGAVDTLIQHPAGLTHRTMAPEARAAAGIGEGLLRLSVGLEDPADLWRDLANGLAAAAAPSARRAAAQRMRGTARKHQAAASSAATRSSTTPRRNMRGMST